jgi:hypothetical protein
MQVNCLILQFCDAPKSWMNKFCRLVYCRPDRSQAVYIEYTNDEVVAAQFPHGNLVKM